MESEQVVQLNKFTCHNCGSHWGARRRWVKTCPFCGYDSVEPIDHYWENPDKKLWGQMK